MIITGWAMFLSFFSDEPLKRLHQWTNIQARHSSFSVLHDKKNLYLEQE